LQYYYTFFVRIVNFLLEITAANVDNQNVDKKSYGYERHFQKEYAT